MRLYPQFLTPGYNNSWLVIAAPTCGGNLDDTRTSAAEIRDHAAATLSHETRHRLEQFLTPLRSPIKPPVCSLQYISRSASWIWVPGRVFIIRAQSQHRVIPLPYKLISPLKSPARGRHEYYSASIRARFHMEMGDDYRIRRKLSPEDHRHIARWMSGNATPTVNQLIKLSNKLEMPLGYFFLAKPIDDTPQIFITHLTLRNSSTQQWNVSRTHERAEDDSCQTCRSAFGSAMSIVRTALCSVCTGALYTVRV